MTAAAENIPLPTPPPLKSTPSTNSLNGYFRLEGSQNGKESKPATDKDSAKSEKKRKDSSAKSSVISKSIPSATPSVPTILEGIEPDEGKQDTLLSALQGLFLKITTQKKKTGVIQPHQFVEILKKENGQRRNSFAIIDGSVSTQHYLSIQRFSLIQCIKTRMRC